MYVGSPTAIPGLALFWSKAGQLHDIADAMYGDPYPARRPTAPHAVLSDVLQRFPPALPRRRRRSRARAP